MLHQDPLVALPFSALENFSFGRPGRTSRAELRRQLTEIAGRLGFDLDPDRVVRRMSVGERQQLEIVRLLSLGVKVLILDEPTSGITTDQRVALFEALRQLAGEGLIVLFVSHKLEEVEDLCSSVTVLRQGQVTGAIDLPCPTDALVQMMFGKLVSMSKRPPIPIGDVAIAFQDLTATYGRQQIEGASLEVRAGEVVGLAGLEGSGQVPLLRALAGLVQPDSGSIVLGGSPITRMSSRDRIEAGIHFLPAGRLEEGLFHGLTISEHLVLVAGESPHEATGERRADQAIEHFRIKGRPDSLVEGLSGGNQQRVLLAMMPQDLKVLAMEQPTRGLDIESADAVWTTLLSRRTGGTAILFASADLDELIHYSDRIAVVFDGRIHAVVDSDGLNVDRLGALIGGRQL
jgi:simple sugar transport system ATP-binding protein